MSVLNEMMVLLAINTGVSAATFAVIYRPAKSARLFVSGVGLSFLTLCLTGNVLLVPLLPLIPIVLFVVSLACSLRSLSPKAGRIWIGATSIAIVGGFIGWWTTIIGQLNHVLEQHPVMSLTDRLDYESDIGTAVKFEPDPVWPEPFIDITKNKRTDFENLLSEEGDKVDQYRRVRSFRSLLSAHQNFEIQFRLATGFGVSRQVPFQNWEIDVPDRPLLSLPHEKGDPAIANDLKDSSTVGVDYQPWHQRNLVDFVHPLTLGYMQFDTNIKRPNLTQVLGFQPHAFGTRPEPPKSAGDEHSAWRITALSLVSLLKHRPAAVYVSQNLPNMNELTSVPTRPLDEFEAGAIGKLQGGEELVVQGDSANLRMLGSIRTAFQCQQCHQVERGTLLGAFSYRLKR